LIEQEHNFQIKRHLYPFFVTTIEIRG